VVYNQDRCAQALARLRDDPGALEQADLEQLAVWGGDNLAAKAMAARQVARCPPPPRARQVAAVGDAPANVGVEAEDWKDIIERLKDQPVLYGTFGAAIDILFDLIKTNRDRLEARIRQLENRPPSPEYKGVHQAGTAYARGDLTTRSGGLWLAIENTVEVPGRSEQWRLIVKSGEVQR
jgi:hypothetical protein